MFVKSQLAPRRIRRYIDMVKTLLVAAVLVVQTATPIFRFEADGFWLNLHHFLYVLGRARAKMPDSNAAPWSTLPPIRRQG